MAVRVDKAVRVHESKVLCLVVGRAARGDGLRHKIVDLLAALATEADQDLHCLGRIADGLGGKLAELGMRQQHDGDRLADDHTGGRVVGELRVVRITERLEKGHRLGQVGDRDVEEYLFIHGWVFVYSFNDRNDFGQGVVPFRRDQRIERGHNQERPAHLPEFAADENDGPHDAGGSFCLVGDGQPDPLARPCSPARRRGGAIGRN